MATRKDGTSNATPHSHMVDGKQEACSNPVFGPFGDKTLHGSKLAYGTAKSDPTKRKADDKLKHDEWCFSYWTPNNVNELLAFAKAKPDNVIDLVAAALKADARFDSWQENRGGTTTARVSIDGGEPVRIPKAVVEMLKLAGRKVVDAPKEEKE